MEDGGPFPGKQTKNELLSPSMSMSIFIARIHSTPYQLEKHARGAFGFVLFFFLFSLLGRFDLVYNAVFLSDHSDWHTTG